MNVGQLEARIAQAVATVRRLGFRLVAGRRWGATPGKHGWQASSDVREVCICGAIALAENPTSRAGIIVAVAKKFGITPAQAASLSDGFEGALDPSSWDRHYEIDKVWYRIGRKWRRRADEVRN